MTAGILTLAILIVGPASLGEALPNLDKALAVQERLALEQPYDSATHNDLGNLLVLAHRNEEAEAAYGRALELDPENLSARFNLGLLLHEEERLGEALDAFEAVAAAAPGHAWAHYHIGRVLAAQGSRKKAVAAYALAFALAPDLTFPENNPHIIENRLATEAILRSREYEAKISKATPRLYGDANRIRDLMLESEAEETEPEPIAAAEEEEASEEAARERVERRRRNRDNPVAGEAEPTTGEPAAVPRRRAAAGQGAPEDATADGSRPAARERTNNRGNNRGNNRVTVIGSPSAAAPESPTANRGRAGQPTQRTPGRSATVNRGRGGGGGVRPQGNNTRQGGGPRYRPPTSSTGRLDLELLPAGPETRETLPRASR
jgi:Tfp pilus assembly protein PilF